MGTDTGQVSGTLAMFAEFEVDMIKMRTREGMAIARDKDKLKGKPPKLTADQRTGLLALDLEFILNLHALPTNQDLNGSEGPLCEPQQSNVNLLLSADD
jgi:DNA invertase Pin-like site-specific DNA recombinase